MASNSISDELAGRLSYRPEQATLIEDVESPSIVPRPSIEKNRGLLTVLSGPGQGTIIQLQEQELTLGRSKKATRLIPDPSLSRVHVRIFRRQSPVRTDFYVEDNESTNGTFVDGRRIQGPVRLTDGVRIDLGRRTTLRFSLQDALEAQALIRVHESAQHDRLTGVFNRGVFDDRLGVELAHSHARAIPLALLLFDIDHFKRLNDTFGHQAGDAVLQAVAESVQQTIGKEDVLARYGGEEFVVIMRAVSERSARIMAERVRVAVQTLSTPWEGRNIGATISIGVAHVEAASEPVLASQVVQAADAALYQAKRGGRNRVVFAEQRVG